MLLKPIDRYLNGRELKELHEFGKPAVARVNSIERNRKLGAYEIHYEYFVNNEITKQHDLSSEYPSNITIGDCFSMVYSTKTLQ